MNFQEQLWEYKRNVDRQLLRMTQRRSPRSLYEPIRYMFEAGGKRIRPILTLASCEAVGGKWNRALGAAAAIEILHSFTLVHDDIMDNADTRRGRKTIHKRWDQNTAILAGDEMVALAYESLMQDRTPRLKDVVQTFTEAFTEVCEGQGLDEMFERRRNVGMREYMHMIDKKTAAILSAATTIGAMIGGASEREIHALRSYGRQVGRAFQIQDDVLDMTATTRSWGKGIGGDLKEGKKTYLLVRAFEHSPRRSRALMKHVVRRKAISRKELDQMKSMLAHDGILADARAVVRKSTRNAQAALHALRPKTRRAHRSKEMLTWLANELLERTF